MSKVSIDYYKSCSIPPTIRGCEIKPFFKLMSLQGYDPGNYKCINGEFHPLNALSEPKIYFVIARSQSYLSAMNILDSWRCTTVIPSDNKTFNEEIEFPVPYCDLYEYCHLLLVLSSYFISSDGFLEEKYLNACYLPLYNSHDVFRRGIYELEFHPLDQSKYCTLQSVLQVIHLPEFNGKPKSTPELNRLLKTMRKQLRGQLPNAPMEQTALSQVEHRIYELKNNSKSVFLSIDFRFTREITQTLPVVLTRQNTSAGFAGRVGNPVEKKHYSMTRNARSTIADRLRKPNTEELNEIKKIIEQPPTRTMTDAESDVIWMFRYYICDQKPTALSKVMRAVKWDYQSYTDQVNDILLNWPRLNPEYLMELLTSNFLSPIVRRFAVNKLASATDEELFLYLFQLVQALRYENMEAIMLVQPGNEETGIFYSQQQQQQQQCETSMLYSIQQRSIYNSLSVNRTSIVSNPLNLQEDLATFLIRRCQLNRRLSTYLYWFLLLESQPDSTNTPQVQQMFGHVLERYTKCIEMGTLEIRQNWSELKTQQEFVDKLSELVKTLCESKLRVAYRSELFKSELPKHLGTEMHFILPLNPDFVVAGIDISASFVLKSNLAPVKLCLTSPTNQTYDVIFKEGDDLRQDQVVLQMISFMDEILRRENFNLELTPYKVLATSRKSGFIEFVDSTSISQVLTQYGSIYNYLLKVAPSVQDPDKIDKRVLDTYTRSLAGYCVVTYLLGVGDRHLDNIMIRNTGHLFHVDFGFVLGNDPKPLPPEVRLTKEMIDAMGGSSDPTFFQFCHLTFETFTYLRKHANQCLSLLSLIIDAGIQDFSKDSGKAIEFMRERFHLDCSDEQAIHLLADRITSSVKAILPAMMERFHKFAMMNR